MSEPYIKSSYTVVLTSVLNQNLLIYLYIKDKSQTLLVLFCIASTINTVGFVYVCVCGSAGMERYLIFFLTICLNTENSFTYNAFIIMVHLSVTLY